MVPSHVHAVFVRDLGATHPNGIDVPHIEAPRSYGVRADLSPRGFHLLG